MSRMAHSARWRHQVAKKADDKPSGVKIEVNPTELTPKVSRELLEAAKMSGKIAIDTETTGLDWSLGDRAFMATFSTDVHHTWLSYDMRHGVPEVLRALELQGTKFVFHNSKFDLHMLRASAGWEPVVGYRNFDFEDTMLAFRVLDPLNSAALKVASSKYLSGAEIDVDGPQKQVKAWISGHTERERRNRSWVTLGVRLDEDTPDAAHGGFVMPAGTLVPMDEFNYSLVPRRLMDVYASQDVVLTIASHHGLMADLARLDPTGESLRRTYDRERRLVGHLIEMERHGWPVDKDVMQHMRVQAQSELQQALEDLVKLTGMIDGLLASQKEPIPLNPFSAPQLTKYLYTIRQFPKPPNVTDKGNPTVDEAALTVLPDHRLRDVLLRIRRWKKAYDKSNELSQYVVEERDWHYVHGDYRSDGARTGRLSSTRPALQNISRHEEERPWTHIRNIFRPAPGRSLLFVDWSNIEMRLFAQYAQDPVLLDVFDRDGDAHLAVAARVYGKPEADVTKMERTFAKTLNFSLLYGAGVNRIFEALRYGGAGDPLTIEEMIQSLTFFDAGKAEELHVLTTEAWSSEVERAALADKGFKLLAKNLVETYYEMFPTVRALNKQTSGSVVTRWNKYGRGFVRNMFGRETLVPKEYAHIATNALIQGTSADLTKESTIRMPEALVLVPDADASLFGQIHDEFIFDVLEGHEAELAAVVAPIMTSNPIIDRYIAEQQVKDPLYRKVPLKVEFAIARHDSDWAHKLPLVLS